MDRFRAARTPAVLAAMLALAAACAGPGVAGDAAADVRDLPADPGPYDPVADPAAPDGEGPDVAPTCCTASLCAQVQGTCDPATCRCEPAAACCTDVLCGPAGMACDPGTCRCARVACDVEGAPCDESATPGTHGRPVCTATSAGLFCLRYVTGWGGCAGGTCGAWDDRGCTCGWTGCTPFEDLCEAGQACLAGDWPPLTTGTCGVAGNAGEGEGCSDRGHCAPGLACVNTCQRVQCGLAPGAPSCPAGMACRPLDAWGLLGTCRVPCDPFNPVSPCGPGEWCRAPCAYLDPAPFCTGSDAPPYGLLGGTCVAEPGGRVVGPGADCTSLPCAAGFLCETAVCREACPAGLPPGAARGAAACSAGLECAAVSVGWPVSVVGGACATPCDPFAPDPDVACEPSDACRMSPFATPSLGHCLSRPWQVAAPGEPCYAWGMPCGAGYACDASGPRRASRCEPACHVGAAPGAAGACAQGLHCFRHYDPVARTWAPWGTCGSPCDPFGPGGAQGCPSATACEPRDRDPATGRLVGRCFDPDSGAEGQPCTSAEPGVHPGCAPGLACRPEEGGSRCRVRCDVQWERTGEGACPAGRSCLRAWPPTGDPVMAGCVAE